MGLSESISKRRMVVVINYCFLLLTLLVSFWGYSLGWTSLTIACFWVSVVIVLVTFYPVHIRTGLWRLAHTKIEKLDEREIQQTLQSLRHAYVIFSIVTLAIILSVVILNQYDQTFQLVLFWVLLYLAHSLPSSVLAWTISYVPAYREDKHLSGSEQ